MDQLMMKPAEVAKLIGVGKTQMYRLIKSKEIPSRRVGNSIRIPVAELKAWADGGGEQKRAREGKARQ